MAAPANTPQALLATMLEVNEKQIVPMTAAGVALGNKVFGAAIFEREGFVPHTVATNDERISPLLHSEINCIQTFFSKPAQGRPATKDCIFFCTHEPCSLCLSGISWAGFREFYHLFTYEDSRDLFAIPHDIDITVSVFRVPAPGDTPETLANRPLYNKNNKFFTSASLADLIAKIEDPAERAHWAAEVARVKSMYVQLSDKYQEGKKAGKETSSVWQ
ncbi:MAG: hypothetical protein SEPTF4163_002137 [Sporothrix epigloea]